jgi:hypothetical protein
VAALFWGNCFSCPQLLLSLAQKSPHGCCKRQAPVTRTCTTSVLKQFVKADPAPVTAPLAVPVEVQALMTPPAAYRAAVVVQGIHSPPDLLELTSSLRI